jgi:ketosteroid isomerase-like protein
MANSTPKKAEQRVQEDLDRIEIMQLLYGWMLAQDEKNWAGLHDFVTEESTFASPRFGLQRGPDQIEANVKRALAHIEKTLHVITGEVIEVEGDTAKATFYVNAHHFQSSAAGGEYFTNRAKHVDDLIRTVDGWKIKHVQAKAIWGEGNPEVRVRKEDAGTHVKAH